MSALEIFLLIAGACLAAVSFILPVEKEEVPRETQKAAKEEIKKMVNDEMDTIRNHVDDVVNEAVEYAMEKTERSLERLTNEKIMAVNEYSDTVLKEIHKNHEEAMFLYDMLNDKHTNLKNTVTEAHRTVKEVKETKKEAEAVVNSFQQLMPEPLEQGAGQILESNPPAREKAQEKRETSEKSVSEKRVPEKNVSVAAFAPPHVDREENHNDEIMALYKKGKSTVAIAKELGLGVGEVKLVIDLYKNM